jgi:hypothetical protein
MITITIDRAKGKPIQFSWDATAEEFRHLYNHFEELTANEGRDPQEIANAVIHMLATKGELKDPVQRRGQRTWTVYAVLRYAQDNIDLSNMVDQAGVLTGPPTIFDLAEHQHIKTKMRVGDGTIQMELSGSSPLDS